MDFSGHGTGVAGIIAAKTDHYVGIAPEATLGAYRIGGYRRDVYHDAIPKAIDMAIADGMDIINMSFGGLAAVVPKNLLDAFEKAAKNNIVVVAATANANYDFMWNTNFPADIPSVISVGTADARQVVVRRFKAESMKDPLHYDTICSNAQRLYMGGEVGIKLQLPQGDPKNKQCVLSRAIGQVILVPFFHCPIEELIAQAKANGAAGIMAPGLMYTDREIMCSTPVYAITDETFVSVYYHLQQRPDDDWIFTKDNGKMDLTPHIDSTTGSTWGPNLHMTLSPDMIAPGKDIFLTTAVKKGSYTLDTGTSFAAPYASGMIALWFQHLGVDKVKKEARMPVARVKDLLRNACTPLTPSGDDSPSPVAHQGAGLLNVTTLLTTGTHVSPSAIEVSSEAYSKKRTVTPRGMVTSAQLTIINNLDVAQTYNFVHKPAPSVRGFDSSFKAIFPPQEVNEYANVVIKPATITVKGKGSVTVSVTIAEPPKLPLAENWVYSGYIEVQPVAIKTQPAIHVPYLGLKGNIGYVFKYLKQL
ncbi:peptidase S8/S53 domain-containing protein [Syncephalis plumigaleata]|nr:peptidase S8/S53 domain-containing protein [Syncephalis plumigaleata]